MHSRKHLLHSWEFHAPNSGHTFHDALLPQCLHCRTFHSPSPSLIRSQGFAKKQRQEWRSKWAGLPPQEPTEGILLQWGRNSQPEVENVDQNVQDPLFLLQPSSKWALGGGGGVDSEISHDFEWGGILILSILGTFSASGWLFLHLQGRTIWKSNSQPEAENVDQN